MKYLLLSIFATCIAFSQVALISPKNNEMLFKPDVEFKFTSYNDKDVYRINLERKNGEFNFIKLETGGYYNQKSANIKLNQGEFRWSIDAIDTVTGIIVPTQYNQYFKIFDTVNVKPLLIFPIDDTLMQRTTFSIYWMQVDLALAYHLQIAFDSNFTDMYIERKDITDYPAYLNDIEYSKRYFWRIRAVYGKNLFSKWSDVESFRTANKKIDSVKLLYPRNKEKLIENYQTDFSWTKSKDATEYYIYVYKDSINSKDLWFTFTDKTGISKDLEFNSKYYWCVSSYDYMKKKIDSSSIFEFYTLDTLKPPAIITADSNQQSSFIFYWQNDINTLQNIIQVSRTNDFKQLVQSDTIKSTYPFKHIIGKLDEGNNYFLRIKSKRTTYESNWSYYSFNVPKTTSIETINKAKLIEIINGELDYLISAFEYSGKKILEVSNVEDLNNLEGAFIIKLSIKEKVHFYKIFLSK